MNSRNRITFATAVLAGLALLVVGCGGSGYGDAAEPSQTIAAPASPETERAPSSATVEATPANPAVEPTPVPATTPVPPAPLTLAASLVQFDASSLSAPAGPVTIAFENRDQGIPHNVHVFLGTDASGIDIGATEIQAGPIQQTLALGDLASGSYFYQCDVHPSQMAGTLTVS